MNKKRNYLKLSTLFFSLMLTMVFALSIPSTSKAASLGKVTNLKQTYGSYDTKEGKYYIDVEYTPISSAYCYLAQLSTDNKNWSFVNEYSTNNVLSIGSSTTLTANKVYYLRIIPATYSGEYNESDASNSIQVITAPANVSGQVIETTAKTNSITASWSAATGATNYDVWVKKYGDSDYVFVGSTKSTSYKITKYNGKKLAADTPYYVSITATKTSTAGFKAEAVPTYGYPLYTLPSKTSKIVADDWKPGTSSLKIVWSGSYVADGYEVQFYNAKNKSLKKATTTKNYYTLSKAPKNSFCSVKVRPFIKNAKGKKIYSDWSKKTYFISQANMSNKKYTIGYGSLTLRWEKVSGASKYTIYAGTSSSNMKKVATVSSSKTSYTLSKISGSTVSRYGTYYVKVVPQKKVSGKTIKGDHGYYYVIR